MTTIGLLGGLAGMSSRSGNEGVYARPWMVYIAPIMRHFDARAAVGYGITAHWYRLCQPIIGSALWDVALLGYLLGRGFDWCQSGLQEFRLAIIGKFFDTDELRSWGTIRFL